MKHFPNYKIDKGLWDNIVSNSTNSRIYGMSWWLDAVFPKWQGFINPIKEEVIPLCYKGWFQKRIVQPVFTQQLGLFRKSEASQISSEVISRITSSCGKGYMQWNANNKLESNGTGKVNSRTNLIVERNNKDNPLDRFSSNHKRNYEKALEAKIKCRAITLDEFLLSFYAYNPVYNSDIKPHQKTFLRLLNEMKNHNSIKCLGAFENQEIVAGVVLGLHQNRWTHLFPFTSPSGRKNGAMHFLTHEVLNGKMGEIDCLDFEGSEIDGVARFYRGFGATDQSYPTLTW